MAVRETHIITEAHTIKGSPAMRESHVITEAHTKRDVDMLYTHTIVEVHVRSAGAPAVLEIID